MTRYSRHVFIMSPSHRAEALSDAFVWGLSVVYIGPNSRTDRPRKTKMECTPQSRPRGPLLFSQPISELFPSVLRHCWLGDWKGIRPVKKLGVGGDDLTGSFAQLIAPVVTITSIMLSFNKSNAAKPGSTGKKLAIKTEWENPHPNSNT